MSQESSRPPRVPRRVGGSSQGSSAGGGKPAKSSKSSGSGKAAGNPAILKWVVRGVVGGLLIGLVIVAALDFMKKGQYTDTGDAWIAEFNKAESSGTPLKFSKLEPLMVGTPTRTEDTQATGVNVNKTKTYTYTWNGTFRKYVIDVQVQEEPGSDATVSKVDVGGRK